MTLHAYSCCTIYFYFFGMLQTMEGEDEVSRDFRLKINNNNEVGMRKKCKKVASVSRVSIYATTCKDVCNSLLNNIHDNFWECSTLCS